MQERVTMANTLHFNITDADGNLQGRGIGVFQHSAQLPPVTLQRSDTLRLQQRLIIFHVNVMSCLNLCNNVFIREYKTVMIFN